MADVVNNVGDRSFRSHSLELSWETIHKITADYLDANTDGNPSAERLNIFYDALFRLICDRELSFNAVVLLEVTLYLASNKWLIIENRDKWNRIQDQLWRGSIDFQLEAVYRIRAMLAALSITTLLEGKTIALRKLVEKFLYGQNLKIDMSNIGELLFNKGWYQNLSGYELGAIVDPNSIIKSLDGEGDKDNRVIIRILALLDIFAFKVTQPEDWLFKVVNGIVLPMMRLSLDQQKYQMAFGLEEKLYSMYLKSNEIEEHYNSAIALWAPMMENAGRAFHCELTVPPDINNVPKVGFFIHFATTLAHIQLMCSALDGASTISPRHFLPVVYIFDGYNEELASNLDQIGVEVVWLRQEVPHLFYPRARVLDKFIWLRERMRQDQITACVWVSNTTHMSFAFSMRLAPVQIWWAMKFHPNCFNNVDGYITQGSFSGNKVRHFGREWHVIPPSFLEEHLYDSSLSQQAMDLRSQFDKFDIVLGTLAREERIASPDFLNTIVKILENNPNVVWLYTGKEDHPMIQRYLDAENIGEQSRFIGWVDTKLYAQVIDIFIDTWPFCSGLCAVQAMAAGKPYVFYNDDTVYEGERGLMIKLVVNVLRTYSDDNPTVTKLKQIFEISGNDRLLLNAESSDEYIKMVNRLISDSIFRKNCGDAHKSYIDTFHTNVALFGRCLGEQILDIIEIQRRNEKMSTETTQNIG